MNPQDASAGLPPLRDGFQWAVVHCRPRCEKKVAEYCHGKGWYCYLPLLVKTHRYGNRRRHYEIPVFAGYLFVVSDAATRSHLRQHQRVANVLEVADQNLLARQLGQVKAALDNQQVVELLPRLAEGMKVVVRDGPLKGVEGIVEKIKSRSRIVLNVDFIQQSLAVEMDPEWLIPV